MWHEIRKIINFRFEKNPCPQLSRYYKCRVLPLDKDWGAKLFGVMGETGWHPRAAKTESVRESGYAGRAPMASAGTSFKFLSLIYNLHLCQ